MIEPAPKPAKAAATALPDLGPVMTRRAAAPGAPDLGVARYAYVGAALAAVAWAGMLVAYTLGYVGSWHALPMHRRNWP